MGFVVIKWIGPNGPDYNLALSLASSVLDKRSKQPSGYL
jgi:hypothetical protein